MQEHRIIDDEGNYSTQVFNKDTIICEMHWAGEKIRNTTYSRRGENAKLIAAAPELLQFAIEMARRYPNSPWINEEANKLIEKATK
jgi:hypothetical protein